MGGDGSYGGRGWSSAPTIPAAFTYDAFPVQTMKCAGCAVQQADTWGPLNCPEVEVGCLKVCRLHVKWALRQMRKAAK